MDFMGNELIIGFIGTIIIIFSSLIDKPHLKYFNQEKKWHRYKIKYWSPIYRNTKTKKLNLNVKGFNYFWSPIKPVTFWIIIGSIFIVIGFTLQFYV